MNYDSYMTPGLRKALEDRRKKQDRLPYTKVKVTQGEAAWLMRRMGHITSTRVRRIISQREEVFARLLSEMIQEYHELKPHGYYYQSEQMEHGHICEPQARELASYIADDQFYETGFFVYKKEPILAGSNDGLTKDGKIVLEAKCPYTVEAFNKLKNKGIENYHYMQCQQHMLVTGAEKCLYVAFFSGPGIEHFKEQAYHYEWVWPDQAMRQRILHQARRVQEYLEKEGCIMTDERRNTGLYRQNMMHLQSEIIRVGRYHERRRSAANE